MDAATLLYRRLMKRKLTSSAGKAKASPARARPRFAPPEEEDPPRPPRDTLLRTKALLLAALRVWELKNGIEPYGAWGSKRGGGEHLG